MDSDDSDFYGDDDIVIPLKQRVGAFDVAEWWKLREVVPLSPAAVKKEDTPSYAQLHNPYEGVPSAWQLTETLDNFFARLPPATTDVKPELPWIYICNPYIPRKSRSEAQNQKSKGNEDEAPEEEGSKLSLATEGAMERLHLLEQFIQGASTMGKDTDPSAATRDINKERRLATQNILDLGHACKIRPGKWMLFCDPLTVNDVWETVARATANNELGIAAKVAPRDSDNPKKERLVCVYTADFKDKRDVGRVLQRLRELRLIESRGRLVYYKPDIFTYIGIAYGNKWGLRASIYSSKDVFPSS